MGPDKTIWLAGILIEAAVVGMVFYKRIWRLLPLFCVYLVWDLLSNIVGFASDSAFTNYLTIYFVETVIDSVLQFGVLVEVAWSVLRPIRSSLPRYTLVFVAALILAVGATVWPFVSMTPALAHYAGYAGRVQLVLHLQQTVAILRILFFLALAGCSQLLSIGWRDRELQVATGLGVYSLVSLAVVVLEAHQTSAQNYKTLQYYVIGGFICSLLYWGFSFAQKEAERREFTPQMQSFLLAMAGAARANRAALAESAIADSSFRRKG